MKYGIPDMSYQLKSILETSAHGMKKHRTYTPLYLVNLGYGNATYCSVAKMQGMEAFRNGSFVSNKSQVGQAKIWMHGSRCGSLFGFNGFLVMLTCNSIVFLCFRCCSYL